MTKRTAVAADGLDAVVVGAGPGGSAAAFHLARRGRRVLLVERSRFPRDKSCGDGVTRASVRLLDEMGLGEELSRFQAIRGVEVRMRNRGSRVFEYPTAIAPPRAGVVVPRYVLDELIVRRAVESGATLWEEARATDLLWQGDAIVGVSVQRDGRVTDVHAPIVVAADGAASALGRQADMAGTPPDQLGTAIRGYYTGVDGLNELLEIDMPLHDISDRYLLPSYGWVFPTGESEANVGVGVFERSAGVNVRELMERYIDALRSSDPRFAGIRPVGAWRGAPLRFDFSPERTARPGLALVGDAAGLISPFTGEGISFALESGKLVAEAIDRSLAERRNGALELESYRRALGNRYSGYFETGRHGARRYRVIWHVLDDTFQVDRPAFRLARQAVLFPEGLGESLVDSLFDDIAAYTGAWRSRLRADLLGVSQVLVDTVRRDWPFVARSFVFDEAADTVPLRPATVLLLASYIGSADPGAAAQLGAALELGHLGALSHLSVVESKAQASGHDTNWGNTFAVLTGDYLLAKAYAMTADVSAEISVTVADAVARACEARIRESRTVWRLDIPVAERVTTLVGKLASLFEIPALIGASVANVEAANRESIRLAAQHAGVAHQLAAELSEIQATRNESATQLSSLISGQLAEGIMTTPILAAAEDRATRVRLEELASAPDRAAALAEGVEVIRASGAGKRIADLARSYMRRARTAYLAVEAAPGSDAFASLLDFVESEVEVAAVAAGRG